MPAYFPEGNTPLASDSVERSLAKWCDFLYQTYGDHGPAYFPEGSQPRAGDDSGRLLQKINSIYFSILGP